MRTVLRALAHLLRAMRTPSSDSERTAPTLNYWSAVYTHSEIAAPPALREVR